MNKIIIISGSTASGKTSLGLKLAKDFDGEIISADSRQVYKGMDIVTGKDLPKNLRINSDGSYRWNGVRMWGLDMVNPDQNFDVSYFVKYGRRKIDEIQSRRKLPIIVGGTAFWLRSLLDPPNTLGIPQNQALRKEFEKLNIKELQLKLNKLDKQKLESMNNSDRNNPRRLVRAIEVSSQKKINLGKLNYEKIRTDRLFWMGIKIDMAGLEEKIEKRVSKRMKEGAVEETIKLASKYSWKLPSMSGIGYKDLKQYLENKQNDEETIRLWTLHELQYAKRQMTFLKKEEKIRWYELHKGSGYDKIKADILDFLQN